MKRLRFSSCALLVLTLAMPYRAHSLTISDISFINQSDPDILEITTDYAHEFQSRIIGVTVSQLSPLVTKVSAHLSWSANVIKYSPTDLPFDTSDRIGASISFKVNDPLLLGYNVEYFGYTIGFYTGQMTNVVPDPNEWVGDIWMKPAMMLSLVSSGPQDEIYGGWSGTDQVYPFANDAVGASTPSFIMGSWTTGPDQFGTHDFGVGIRSAYGFRSEFDPLMTGETAARFGLEPAHNGFALGSYQNALDGQSAANHGLFLDFTITSLASRPVPDGLNMAATLFVTLAAMLLAGRLTDRDREPAVQR